MSADIQSTVQELQSTELNRLVPILHEHATRYESLAAKAKSIQIQHQMNFIAADDVHDTELARLYVPSINFYRKSMLRYTQLAVSIRSLASFLEENVTIQGIWSYIAEVVEAVNNAVSSGNNQIHAILKELHAAAEEQSSNITNQCRDGGNEEGDGGHLNEQ